MGDYVGQQLGNYRLIRLVGEGGFAEVYLGEHIHLNTQAAIKVLHTQLASDDIERFRDEARIIARLSHPYIVRVLEFGVEGKVPFLIMDYAPNGTLRKLHPKGTQLPLATIVSYVKQVASALQYAHDEKLIHRDIKPENMLLGRRQEVLLSDFGIALVAQSSRYQSTRDMAGTIAYMAPEQIEAHPRPASDQYSLGIVAYEWLNGDRPFHGSFTEIAIKHSLVPPPSLCEKVPTLSPVVEQVVMTALAKNPKQRFATVQAFSNALEQASLISPDAIVQLSQSPRSPDMVTVLSQAQQSTQLVTLPNQSSLPAEPVPLSSQTSLSTELIAPLSPSSRPTEAASPMHPPAPLLQHAPLTKSNTDTNTHMPSAARSNSSTPAKGSRLRTSIIMTVIFILVIVLILVIALLALNKVHATHGKVQWYPIEAQVLSNERNLSLSVTSTSTPAVVGIRACRAGIPTSPGIAERTAGTQTGHTSGNQWHWLA